MRYLASLITALGLPLYAQFAVSTPANGATISGNGTRLTIVNTPAGTEKVEYWYNGELLVASHAINGNCGSYEVCPGVGFSAGFVTTDGPDQTNAQIYALAKDIFGTVLATSATNTFAIRNLGPIATMVPPVQPWSGDTLVPYSVNGVSGNGYMGTQPGFAIDGYSATGNGNPWLTGSGPNLVVHSARLPNGLHDISMIMSNNGVSVTPNFPASAVNTVANTITIAAHPFLTGAGGGNPNGFVYSTSGTVIGGLTAGGTYFPAVIDANTIKVASSAANAITCAASATNCITLTSQGTGTHTFTYKWVHPYYGHSTCIAGSGDCWSGPMAMYRFQANIQNGSAAMEMRGVPEEIVLYQDLGPTTYQIAPFVENCDGTTTAMASNTPTYTSSNTAVATVSASGLVTLAGAGFADITAHCTIGACNGLPDAISHVSVYAVTNFPHLSKNGQTLTTYTPGSSAFANSIFQIGYQYAQSTSAICAEYQWSGNLNTEESLPPSVSDPATANYATALSAWNTQWGTIQQFANQCNHSVWFNYQFVNVFFQLLATYNNYGWPNTVGQRRVDLFQTIATNIAAFPRGTQLIYAGDEISNEWRFDPAPAGLVCNGCQFSQIVVTGCPSTPCTGTATLSYNTQFFIPGVNGTAQTYIKLSGCTTANLCGPYIVQSPVTNDPVTIGWFLTATITTHNVLNGTYNAATDPGMTITYWTYCGDGSCSQPYVAPGHNCSAGACVTKQVWDANFTQIVVAGASDPRTATVTWTGCCGTDPAALVTGSIVMVASATTAGLNNAYVVTAINANSFSFQTWGVAAGTYNSTTDAGLYLNIDGSTTAHTLTDVKNVLLNVSGAPAYSWPILGSLFGGGAVNYATNKPATNWENTPSVASASMVFSQGPSPVTWGDHMSSYDGISDKRITMISARNTWMRPSVDLIGFTPLQFEKFGPSPACYFQPGGDLIQTQINTPSMSLSQMAFVVAKGSVGKRAYHAGQNQSTNAGADSSLCVGNGRGIDQGPDPLNFWMPFWNAMALDNNTDNRLIDLLFQPFAVSPGFGPFFFSGARKSLNGNILVVGSLASISRSQTIDFTPYLITGGTIRRYRLTADRLLVQTISGTSDSPTFAPAEVIYYAFDKAGAIPRSTTLSFVGPTSFPPGASKYAVKVNYYHTQNVNATLCTAGCSVEVDTRSNDWWWQGVYLDASNNVVSQGQQMVVPHS